MPKVRVYYIYQGTTSHKFLPYWKVVALDTPPSDMNNLIQFVTTQDWVAWVGAATALLTAVIAVASLIPGDEPEATLQKIVDFLSKLSRK
jgi:type VI protein secretion system component VasF